MMNNIHEVLEQWYICPLHDNVQDLFKLSKDTILHYIELDETLTPSMIINIIKDLRQHINPYTEQNLYYFTDVILDKILLEHKHIARKDVSKLFKCLDTLLDTTLTSKL